MAQREGNIFLYAFIPTFILLVGAVVVVFYQSAELDKSKADYARLTKGVQRSEIQPIKDLQDRSEGFLKEMNELKQLVGGADAPDNWPGNAHYFEKMKESEAKFNEVASTLELTARDYQSLVEPYPDLVDMIDRLKVKWDESNDVAELNRSQVSKVEEVHKSNIEGIEGQLSDLQSRYQSLQSENEDGEAASTKKIEQLTAELEDLREVVGQNQIKYRRELEVKANKVNNLSDQLNRLREQVRKIETVEDIEPDGKIVDVESRSKTAWINLGLKNHMRAGLVFKVFQDAGGKKLWKGSIEVRQVEEDISKVRIVTEEDPLNPIAANDQITSPFYDPKASPEFVFAGQTSAIDMRSVKAKLESIGAKVGKEVRHTTDFLVALQDYDQTSNYQTARELGVVIIREKDLLEYLGQ